LREKSIRFIYIFSKNGQNLEKTLHFCAKNGIFTVFLFPIRASFPLFFSPLRTRVRAPVRALGHQKRDTGARFCAFRGLLRGGCESFCRKMNECEKIIQKPLDKSLRMGYNVRKRICSRQSI
jgi:hypothetical protein